MSNVKKNYFYQLLYQILLSILPFITSPYISRVLGAEGLGIYTYSFSIITYFKIFAALGIGEYGNRAIARVKNDQFQLNKTFTGIYLLHMCLSSVVLTVYLLYCGTLKGYSKIIAYIQGLNLVGEFLETYWFFYGMEKFKLMVTRNTIVKLSTAVAVFIFIQQETDLWKYVLIMALGNLISSAVNWAFIFKMVRFTRVSAKEVLQHIRPMLILFFSVIAISVYSYMDKIMLGSMASLSELGYYENAWKMIEFPAGFITALSSVMMPKISNLVAKGEEKIVDQYISGSLRFSMIAASAIAFGVAGISDCFSVVFWGEDFADCGVLMKTMAVTIILMSWNAVIRTQYLIPRGYDKVYLLAVCGGAAVNFATNWALIPLHGALGATIGTVLAYGTICVIQTCYSAKALMLGRYFVRSLPYMLIGMLMFFAVKMLESMWEYSVFLLIFEVVVGGVIFLASALCYSVLGRDTFIIDNIQLKKRA